jgi:hypothetical protein
MNPAVFIAVAIVVVVGGGLYASWKMEQRRTEELQAACTAMGFRWIGEVPLPDFALPLFEQGHGRRVKNAMEGETADRRVSVMDYTFVTGGGKSQHTHRQTVVVFPDGARGLPDFTLAPENFLHRIGQVFGYQDIDFDGDEAFSSAYLLRGEDETAIRAALNPVVRSFLAGAPGWTVQTKQGAAALFKAEQRCKPPELPAFLADALRILSGLSPRAPS